MNSYERNDKYRLVGSMSYKELKDFINDFKGWCVTVKTLKKSVAVSACNYSYRNRLGGLSRKTIFILNGEFTFKFTDVIKALNFKNGDYVSISIDGKEVIETDNGWYFKEDCVLCYDTDKWLDKDDAYYCESDNEWYSCDDDLVFIDGSYYLTDDDNVFWCEHCQEYHIGSSFEVHIGHGTTEYWCEDCVDNDAFRCDDCGEYWTNNESYNIDRPSCTVCPNCYDENYFCCEECNSYIHRDYYDYDAECCEDCAEQHRKYVKSYHWHHSNYYDNKGHLFLKDSHVPLCDSDVKNTCGIELEVDADDDSNQTDCIEALAEYQLDDNEFYYERDGSLSYGGFEIITAIHTFQSIKSMKWREILRTIQDYGFVSHNGGKCGLHIHVGRKYFGDTENAQNNAIGKIYSFYSLFWDDIVKASRRTSFGYCSNPSSEKPGYELKEQIEKEPSKARHWAFTKASLKQGNHGLALNNSNFGTFEFRLGRGTLFYESFMAWIDFTLTIAKNSRHISTRGLIDIDNWLSGISKQTAEYLKSRGAFPESNIINKLTVTEGVAICA